MPITVEGPDGQRYEFPDGTSPDVMKGAMAKRYQKASPQQGEIPYPSFASKDGIDIMGMDLGQIDQRGQRGMIDIIGDTFKRQSEMVPDIHRQEVERQANAAGAEARGAAREGAMANPGAYALSGMAGWNAGSEAAGKVYNEAGMASPDQAAATTYVNASMLGLPAAINPQFRDALRTSHETQPGPALAGEVGGSVMPGEIAFNAGKGAYNAFAKPIVNNVLPKGGSMLARATRFGVHGAEQAGAWAGQNALYRGTTGASTQAAMENRAPTFEDMAQGAQAGATDPINLIGPAAGIALNRMLTAGSSGGRDWVPNDRRDYVSSLSGLPAGSGTILNAERLGGPVDQRAERILIRMLGDAGYSRDDIRGALSAFDQLANETTDLPLLSARLKDVFIEQLGPEAENVVQDFLQGAGVSRGGAAGGDIRASVDQDYGRIGDFLEASGNARLGTGSRWDTVQGAQDEMRRIGTDGYETVFAQPPQNPQAMESLGRDLEFFAGSELSRPLRQVAAGQGLTVEQMIQRDPRRAAHWMQHTAGGLAQNAADRGDTVLARAYGEMRSRLLNSLEAEGVAPGYRDARLQYGDEYGIVSAQNFGSRFFTRVQDTMGVRQLAEDYNALTPDQQAMARMSIRDEYNRLIGRHRRGAAPRMTQVDTDTALAGLEEVLGPDGAALANDIRYGSDRLRRTQAVDQRVNSRTVSNEQARQFADRTVSNPVVRRVGNALQAIGQDAAISGATGGLTPIMSIRAGAHALGNRLARGRQGKIDDVTRLLLRDVGSTPRPSMPGDVPPTAPPTNAPRGLGRDASPQAQNAFAKNQAGGTKHSGIVPSLRNDMANALVGGAVGGMYPDLNHDGKITNEERLIGAGIGATGFVAGTRFGTKGNYFTPKNGARGLASRNPVRAELPGSPEYERAIAKGLDMSQPARMQRARDMGFDTDTVAYRGMTRPYDAGKAGNFQMFTSSAADAGEFAGNGMVSGGNIVPAYLRKGRNLKLDGGRNNFNSIPVGQLPADVRGNLHPSTGTTARTDEIAYAAQKAGYDSVTIENVFDNAHGEIPRKPRPVPKDDVDKLLAELEAGGFDMNARGSMEIAPEMPKNYDPVRVDVIFDPSNIRSVNAAFDPDMAASPMLTAGPSGMRPKRGLGKTLQETYSETPEPKLPGQPPAKAARNQKLTATGSQKGPKLMPDVPKGRPKPGQRPDLSGTIERGNQQVSGVPVAKAIGGDNFAYQTAKREAEDMMSRKVGLDEIQRRTGLVPISYKGQTAWRSVAEDISPAEANQLFYEALKLPAGERAEWVQNILDELGPKIEPLNLGGNRTPIQLGGPTMPMVAPGKRLPDLPPPRNNRSPK